MRRQVASATGAALVVVPSAVMPRGGLFVGLGACAGRCHSVNRGEVMIDHNKPIAFAPPPPPTTRRHNDGKHYTTAARNADERKQEAIDMAVTAMTGVLYANRWRPLLEAMKELKYHQRTVEMYFPSVTEFVKHRPDLWRLDSCGMRVMRAETAPATAAMQRYRGGAKPMANRGGLRSETG